MNILAKLTFLDASFLEMSSFPEDLGVKKSLHNSHQAKGHSKGSRPCQPIPPSLGGEDPPLKNSLFSSAFEGRPLEFRG